jgi:hypothetical protein
MRNLVRGQGWTYDDFGEGAGREREENRSAGNVPTVDTSARRTASEHRGAEK